MEERAHAHPVEKLVSGGQTGVDQGALDAALERGIPCGGWCPRGRRTEAGVIDARYPLRETPTGEAAQRTEWNVRDSDGTLIIAAGPVTGGTALTLEMARRYGKPCLVFDLHLGEDPAMITGWIRRHGIRVLNVAGPRASEAPGIQ
jgi:hypothetical protein